MSARKPKLFADLVQTPLRRYALERDRYCLIVCRREPDGTARQVAYFTTLAGVIKWLYEQAPREGRAAKELRGMLEEAKALQEALGSLRAPEAPGVESAIKSRATPVPARLRAS